MAITSAVSVEVAMSFFPSYKDPKSPDFLQDREGVLFTAAFVGLLAGMSFMNLFDVVGDTMLYCWALEEQRHAKATGTTYWKNGDEPAVFSACSRKGVMDLFWGDEEDEEEVEDPHRYAPKTLQNILREEDPDY